MSRITVGFSCRVHLYEAEVSNQTHTKFHLWKLLVFIACFRHFHFIPKHIRIFFLLISRLMEIWRENAVDVAITSGEQNQMNPPTESTPPKGPLTSTERALWLTSLSKSPHVLMAASSNSKCVKQTLVPKRHRPVLIRIRWNSSIPPTRL